MSDQRYAQKCKCSNCIKAIHKLEQLEARATELGAHDLAQAAQAAREVRQMTVEQREWTRDMINALAPLIAGFIDGKIPRREALSGWINCGGEVENFDSLTTDQVWTAKAPNLSRDISVDQVLELNFGHEILRKQDWRERLQTIEKIDSLHLRDVVLAAAAMAEAKQTRH
jgi:hypothetical protein